MILWLTQYHIIEIALEHRSPQHFFRILCPSDHNPNPNPNPNPNSNEAVCCGAGRQEAKSGRRPPYNPCWYIK